MNNPTGTGTKRESSTETRVFCHIVNSKILENGDLEVHLLIPKSGPNSGQNQDFKPLERGTDYWTNFERK